MRISAIAIAATVALALVFPRVSGGEESQRYQNLLDVLLEVDSDVLGTPVAYPRGKAEVTAAVVTVPPGGETGWHTHEVPLFVHILDGEVTVDYGARGSRRYVAGESFMEAMDWPHNGTNTGTVPVRILAVYMGSARRQNAVSLPAPD